MFYLVSDIHLEFYQNFDDFKSRNPNLIQPNLNDNLILAGDIGYIFENENLETNITTFKLLKYFKENFKNVIYIAGNHEYYQCKDFNVGINTTDEKIRNVCNSLNIHFLQCGSVCIDGVTIYGCTLFSNVDQITFNKLNDKNRVGSHKSILDIHFRHLTWLKKLIFTGKTIVVTHHVPLKIYPDLSTAYHADIIKEIQKQGVIDFWCCGHLHTNNGINIILNQTTLVSNTVGYNGQYENQKQKKLLALNI